LGLRVVSHGIENDGGLAVTVPGSWVVPRKNKTGLEAERATLSVALALTVTEPETVWPETGLRRVTTGGVVSGVGEGVGVGVGDPPETVTSTALKSKRSVVGAVSFNVTRVLLKGVVPVVA
jgi:hypothetical protein